MNIIDPRAYVHPEAKLGDGNVIGPFCFIDKNTVIGDNNVVHASVITTRYSPEQVSLQNRRT